MLSPSLLYTCCYCWLGCALVAVQAFKPGVQYNYQYESQVVLSELQQHASKQSAQLFLAANLSLSRLQFSSGVSALHLRFLAASATNGLTPTVQDLRPPESAFLLVAREAGSPAWLDSVIAAEDEDPFWLNLARGVASLLRYREGDSAAGNREADTAGECGFGFAWLDGARRRQLEKRTEACENLELAGERNSANPMLFVRRSGSAKSVFEFSDDLAAPLVSVHLKEAHELLLDLPKGFGLRVSSESRAQLADASGSVGDSGASFDSLSAYLQTIGRPTHEVALPTALEFERSDTAGSLAQFLTRLPSYLRDANPSMQALAIVQGLPLARGAKDQTEMRKLLELESNKPHLPNILELYSACGTKPCIGALFEFVAHQVAALSDDLLERLLLALAQSSRAGRPLLDRTVDLLKRLEAAGRWTVVRAAYQTLATLGRKFSTAGAGGPETEVPKLLLDRLAGCEAAGTDQVDSTDCQLAVLSAMANCPSTRYRRPLIRGLLVNATVGSQVTVARLRALQASGPLDSNERQHLAGLLRQRHIPLSDPVRYAIADALGGPAACIESGVDCRSLRRGPDLWLPLRRRYKQPATAGHEEVLAGLTSSAFRSGRIFSTGGDRQGGGGIEYELDILGNRLGGIRLSEFRLTYAPPAANTAPRALTDILGVRLYADAIDSLLDSNSGGGSSGGSEEVAEEATAGMQLGVLGEWLRPRRFFTGTSGLMSAVWNAPESPVGVLQSGFLLHDFATKVHLLNGLVVQATLTGALALNVSGSLSVSIWNRDAESKVLNSIGLTMYAQAGLRTGRFSLDFVSQAQAEMLNTFATFVSFAEAPVRTCLVMSNSPAAVTQSCHVTDTVGPRYDHHSHDFYVPGRSFSLGGRNDRLCKELAPDSDEE